MSPGFLPSPQAAGFGPQANALLRKSATYQKRNVRTNICLLSSPIFFCILLLIIKQLVNNVFFTGQDFVCGCKCVQCCLEGSCTQVTQGVCAEPAKCLQYDKTQCGLQYSSEKQASWCEVLEPSSWPPVVQVPDIKRRAQPARPNITTLITAPDLPASAAYGLSRSLFPQPLHLDNVTLLALLPQLVTPSGTVQGHLFTKHGIVFGTAADASPNLYVDAAFSGGKALNLLLPSSNTTGSGLSCTALRPYWYGSPPNSSLSTSNASNPDPRTNSIPLLSALVAVVAASSNTDIVWEQALAQLAGRPILGDFLAQDTLCADVVLSQQPTETGVNDLLYCGYYQSRCNGTQVTAEYPAAFEFSDADVAELAVSVYYNGTDDTGNGGRSNSLRIQNPVSAAVSAWWARLTGSGAGMRLMGLMGMPKHPTKLKLDFSTLLGPLFYTWVVQMLLPTFLQQLVYEKEKRLRMMMKMHGLGDGAYWLVTYLWFLALYVAYMIIFIVFGAGVGLEIFRRTSMGIQIIFYFLFGNCMIAFAFLLSSLFTSSRTATVVAFIYVFATGLIGELLLKVFMEKAATWVFFIEWIPAFALYRGLWEMAEYSFLAVYRSESGLVFNKLRDSGCGMRATWGIFVVEWAVFMLLGWYLEQVLSSGTGISRHPLYFLDCVRPNRNRRSGSLNRASPTASVQLTAAAATAVDVKPADGSGAVSIAPGEREDVRAERLRVEGMSAAAAASMPIVVRDLRKVYPPLDGGKPKVAVKTLTMAIERGECFGLLGPNGAGKSTSINMLTGFLEPSGGTAVIEGYDINTEMSRIYSLMGVCPQHDLLWEQLTGEEHLLFYGRLKGLSGAELTNAVFAALKSVNLFNNRVGQKQAQKYSGGMKRRLSVAISFIGQPQVVYLDEPSTGLDPASRRNLWDVVRQQKDGRAIILTTHSMEEAEILCDRLGIFVDGQLVCIGNPREITSRYAGYLVFTITVGSGHEDAAQALVKRMSPHARLTYALGGTFKYELPTSDVSLAGVFDAMASAKGLMQVLDWGVANATLEEVFIKFARQIGAETKDQ
ncbi:hypothetical protein Agub_g3573 [Astrephomene gubernaculifera]|uniref:ABC transporter domain-containing protein n=1 Tax=Astrephomene gubernaculifera TaxID=47775 RepID=A0AAD3HJ27_9CHLO|nr:hypothetical protein Agub_g3573 [Astrephomene gubernaculifera]